MLIRYPLDLKLAHADIQVFPALPVSVIGFPLGLSAGGSWPIWKTGHIASDPEVDYEPGRPAFLIDATTRSGMSGAPVVVRLENFRTRDGGYSIASGFRTRLLGVYAGRIHDQSEIGRVWRPNVLEEMFSHNRPSSGSTSFSLASSSLNPYVARLPNQSAP